MEQKYLGIMPYDENDDVEFTGRSEETWALYDRIVRNEYTVYYAASGEGKSSLIRAGLLPILRRRNYFPVYIVFEDKELENISSINDVIDSRIKIEVGKHDVSYEQSVWSKSHFGVEQSEKLKNNLWWKLRNYCFKHEDTELKPLFIFDQFEEVFTKANYEWTDHFFAWLEELSTDYLPDSLRELINSWDIDMPTQKNFKALFSFRTEYLGDLDYWCVQKHFLPSLQENRICLKPLTPKGAREVVNLNESSLGRYAERIIQGCAEYQADVNNENQPCVYALILSVVCKTLSELSDKKREMHLLELAENQDGCINKILLRFYKSKLKDVGLDYAKDEKIIEKIENALVDENGKRRRRDTNEDSMIPIKRWIECLCDKENGLIKVIGKKDNDGEEIHTVEFPHDRLCRAIDSSRKERQGRIIWKLKRQGEWMQFGIITAIVGIIAFLWNSMMPAIKPVISCILFYKEEVDKELVYKGLEKIRNEFCNYLQGKPSVVNDVSLDEGFSTIILMVVLLVFVPLLSIFIMGKRKKWYILSTTTSLISAIVLGLLLYSNRSIEYTNNYVSILTIIGFCASIIVLIISCIRLKASFDRDFIASSDNTQSSLWPLWGGYFLFSVYAFYETLFRTTFGINEPSDSFWAITVLPVLFFYLGMGIF